MCIKQERRETKIKNKGVKVGGNEGKEERWEGGRRKKRNTNNKCDCLRRSKTTVSTQSISHSSTY